LSVAPRAGGEPSVIEYVNAGGGNVGTEVTTVNVRAAPSVTVWFGIETIG
jgi:hypothetical protein